MIAAAVTGAMMLSMFTGCGKSDKSEKDSASASENGVLRVGMECAYAPFNWTQTSPEVSNGATAPEIYGGGGYAYGYDVMVAQKLADEKAKY